MIRASDSTYHTWLERGQHQASSGDDKDKYKHTQIQIQGQRQRQAHTQMMGESPRLDETRRMEIGGEYISNLNSLSLSLSLSLPPPPPSPHQHINTNTNTQTHTRAHILTQTQTAQLMESREWYICRTHRVPTIQLLFSFFSHNPRNLRA